MEWRIIQVYYIYCALYFYYYYVSPTSDHPALDPRGWGTPALKDGIFIVLCIHGNTSSFVVGCKRCSKESAQRNAMVHPSPLQDLLKHMLGPTSGVSDSVDQGWSPRICLLTSFQGVLMLLLQDYILRNTDILRVSVRSQQTSLPALSSLLINHGSVDKCLGLFPHL